MTAIGVGSALYPVSITSTVDHAVSEDSERLRDRIRLIEAHASRALSLDRSAALWEEIRRIGRECSSEGWDGYDAKPINPHALVDAFVLSRMLPRTVSPPEIVPEASGALGFEWRNDSGAVLVISLPGNGEIQYAGLFAGGDRHYGARRFTEEIPPDIKTLLLTHFQERRS